MVIDVSAAELAATSFQSGSGADANLQVRAHDGLDWSAWTQFSVTAPVDQAPVVGAPSVDAAHISFLTGAPGHVELASDQTVSLASLFGLPASVTDAEGDAITKYAFAQGGPGAEAPDGGHIVVGGVAQAINQVFEVSAADLALANYVAASAVGGAEIIAIKAFDGMKYSDDWHFVTATTVNP